MIGSPADGLQCARRLPEIEEVHQPCGARVASLRHGEGGGLAGFGEGGAGDGGAGDAHLGDGGELCKQRDREFSKTTSSMQLKYDGVSE